MQTGYPHRRHYTYFSNDVEPINGLVGIYNLGNETSCASRTRQRCFRRRRCSSSGSNGPGIPSHQRLRCPPRLTALIRRAQPGQGTSQEKTKTPQPLVLTGPSPSGMTCGNSSGHRDGGERCRDVGAEPPAGVVEPRLGIRVARQVPAGPGQGAVDVGSRCDNVADLLVSGSWRVGRQFLVDAELPYHHMFTETPGVGERLSRLRRGGRCVDVVVEEVGHFEQGGDRGRC